jgi:hypothetical protein
MDGLFVVIDGRERRPASKKEVKSLASSPELIFIECTSMFGGYSGPASELEVGKTVTFVGPDPYRNRRFYGTLRRGSDGKVVVS